MGLFRIEDNVLVISRDELRDIEEFNKIIKRDKGSDGDADGRKKFQAYKELMYVYHQADFEAPFAKLSGKDKETRILKACKLSNDFRPDPVIKAAIEKYHELFYAKYPSYRILNSLEKGISMSDTIINHLIDSMQSQLETITKANEQGGITINVDNLMANLNSLMSISSSIPKALESIENVREKVKVEQGSNGMVVRGGREKGNREDPKPIERDEDDN